MTEFEQDVIERLTRIETHVEPIADHEKRIRSVEGRLGFLSGAIGLMAPVLGWFGLHVSLH